MYNNNYDLVNKLCSVSNTLSELVSSLEIAKKAAAIGGESSSRTIEYEEETKQDDLIAPSPRKKEEGDVVSPVLQLPQEVLSFDVLDFLDARDLARLEQVCKGWHTLCPAPSSVTTTTTTPLFDRGTSIHLAARRALMQLQPSRTALEWNDVSWVHALGKQERRFLDCQFQYETTETVAKAFTNGPLKADYTKQEVKPLLASNLHGFKKRVFTMSKSSRECDFDGIQRPITVPKQLDNGKTVQMGVKPKEIFFCAKTTRNNTYSSSVVLGSMDKIGFKKVEVTGYSNDVKEGLVSSWCFGIDSKIKIFGPQSNGLMIKDICEYQANVWYAVKITLDWDEKVYACEVRDASPFFDMFEVPVLGNRPDEQDAKPCTPKQQKTHRFQKLGNVLDCEDVFEDLELKGSGSVNFWDKEMEDVHTLFMFNHSPHVESCVDGVNFKF